MRPRRLRPRRLSPPHLPAPLAALAVLAAALVPLAALTASTVFTPSAQASTLTEHFEKSVPLRSGGTLEVQNVNGGMTVEAWDRDEVHVEATKKVRAGSAEEARNALRQITIEVSESDGRVRVVTQMPNRDAGFFDWLFGHHLERSVEYHIQAPRHLDLDARDVNGGVHLSGTRGRARLETTNGSIVAEQVEGSLRLETTNGSITLREAAGQVRAETTNGHVEADLSRVDGELSFGTTNGRIEIRLPRDVRASIDAETTNGSVRSDFDVVSRGKISRRHLRGDINGGGGRLVASTTNGGIRIHSSS